MQIKIFSIPMIDSIEAQIELNQFLRSHRVVDVRKELGVQNGNHYWTFCITYLDDAKAFKVGATMIDYKQVLDAPSFERFSQMRRIRKDLAQNEAVPAFAIFTDAELAEFSKQEQLTLSKMRSVDGVGEKKLEKYGKYFLTQTDEDEKSGALD